MPKRKFDVKLRKVGNSYVVTVPKDTVDRFRLEEGDFLALSLDTNEIKRNENKQNQTKQKSEKDNKNQNKK